MIAANAERAPELADSAPLDVVEDLVREPTRLVDGMIGESAAARARTLLATVAIGGGIFGAVVGAHRGGAQIAIAALKIPAILLVTLVVCVPAFLGLARGLGLSTSTSEVIATTLAACARMALVLAGLAPVVWLFEGWASYHGAVIVVAAATGAAGLAGASLLLRSFARRGRFGAIAGVAMLLVYGLVGAQSAWLLRPFLVHPSTTRVPLLQPLEGDLFAALRASLRSASGSYDDDDGAWLGRRTPRRAPGSPR